MISRSVHLRGLLVFAATGFIGAIEFHSRSVRSVS